ncbi:MAG: MFS transporter [Proteobacteria bacterium]|nr:MFS transporter [Pseudomonadota bacterium]
MVVDLVGFGVVIPVLPFVVKDLGASATVLGGILSAYAATQFLFAPVWGRLSDRFGRRPVLLSTIAGTALSLALLAASESLVWILAARLLGGAFAANVSVASAYIADATDEAERTRWMGLLGASFGIGFVLGPALGGALAPVAPSAPLWAAAGLAGINFLYAVVALREPPHESGGAPTPSPDQTRLGTLRSTSVRRLCLANLAFALAVTQLETVFPYFMSDRFGFETPQFAALLVGMAVVMGGIQGGGMKPLSARFGERTLVVAGCGLLAFGFAAIPPVFSFALLLIPLLVSAVGRALIQPSLMSLASVVATPATRGAVMGTYQAAGSLARVFGPAAAGWLYDRGVSLPFWLAAGLVLAVALAGRWLPDRTPELEA